MVMNSQRTRVVLVLACFALFGASLAQNKKPSSVAASVDKALALFGPIDKTWTLAKFRKELPKGTRFGKVEWEYGPEGIDLGNVLTFRGSLNGEVLFLSALQAASVQSGKAVASRKYSLSDRLVIVSITLSDQPVKNKAFGEAVISRLTDRFGKPRQKTWHPFTSKYVSDEPEGGESPPGWLVEWKYSRGAELVYEELTIDKFQAARYGQHRQAQEQWQVPILKLVVS